MDSFHVLTKWPKAFSIHKFLKKVIEIQKFDFHTLKLAKSEIFRDCVKPLWKGPRWILLAGKHPGCCCFDAWEWFELILASQPVKNRCLVYLGRLSLFWSILGREDGSEASGRAPVNICWLEMSLKCFYLMLGMVCIVFLFIWSNFFLYMSPR